MPTYDLIRGVNRDNLPQVSPSHADLAALQEHPDALDNLELYESYRASQTKWANEAAKSENFVHNVMFTKEQLDALAQRGQSATPINVIWPAVEQAVAMLTTNHPRFQVTAREDSDRRVARVMSEILSWIWNESSGNERLKNALYDYYIKGRGVLHCYVDPNKDYGKGDVCIKDVDPTEVYPDPNSEDRLWRDAAHILTSRVLTREQIERMWPEAADVMHYADEEHGHYDQSNQEVAAQGQQFKGEVDDSYHQKHRVIERYTKVKMPYHNVTELFSDDEFLFLDAQFQEYMAMPAAILSGQGGEQVVNGQDLPQWQARWEEGQPTEDPRVRVFTFPQEQDPETGEVIPPEEVIIAMITNAELVQMGQITTRKFLEDRIKLVITVGGRLFYTGHLPISEYPLVPINNRHMRTPYPMSDVQFVVPIQQQINKLQALITANLASSTNVKAWVPRGSVDKQQVEEDFAKAGAAVMEYDAEFGAPVIAQPVPIPSGVFTQFQNLIAMVEREMGIYALMQGDPTSAPDTHKGTIAIEQFGQRRIRSKLDDVENAMNHLATHVVIPLMQATYTERKVIRLVEPNNTRREVEVNIPLYDTYGAAVGKALDLTSGRYDGIVVTGSTLPSNRFALLDYYMDFYREGVIDQEEVLKKTDVIDAEGVLQRASITAQMQQQLQQQSEQIKNLEGDLQTRERELFHAKLDLDVERARAKVTRTADRVEKAADLNEARQKDMLQMGREKLALAEREARMKAQQQKRATSTVKK